MNNNKSGNVSSSLYEKNKIEKIKTIQSLHEKIVVDFLLSKGSLKKDFLKRIIHV
jgi:hypothetical protein